MTTALHTIFKPFIAALCALMLLAAQPAIAREQKINFIRDAEIEGLLRVFTKPIFKAAGLPSSGVHIYLVSDPSINAFVAGGQRIFVYTGLLIKAKSPNEIIGVLAHETGHIAGGHLSRMEVQLSKASNLAIATMLLGAVTSVGAAVAGQSGAAQAGQGIILGGQSAAQRLVLSYARAQESSADQAAAKYLERTHQSGKGMLDLFYRLSNEALASVARRNPYVQSHPMPLERIRNLERIVKKSKYYNKPDSPGWKLRLALVKAKLAGFQTSLHSVYRRYPKSNKSLPARYARSIAAFRAGDLKNALPIIDSLIKDIPQNPYFWELKGQALLENGKASQAVAPLNKAVKLLPKSGLLRILQAQALINTSSKKNARLAIATLKKARHDENDSPHLHSLMASAYGKIGDIGRAELETAESGLMSGDKKLAVQKAQRARKLLKKNTPDWLRANDILNYARRKK